MFVQQDARTADQVPKAVPSVHARAATIYQPTTSSPHRDPAIPQIIGKRSLDVSNLDSFASVTPSSSLAKSSDIRTTERHILLYDAARWPRLACLTTYLEEI